MDFIDIIRKNKETDDDNLFANLDGAEVKQLKVLLTCGSRKRIAKAEAVVRH